MSIISPKNTKTLFLSRKKTTDRKVSMPSPSINPFNALIINGQLSYSSSSLKLLLGIRSFMTFAFFVEFCCLKILQFCFLYLTCKFIYSCIRENSPNRTTDQ